MAVPFDDNTATSLAWTRLDALAQQLFPLHPAWAKDTGRLNDDLMHVNSWVGTGQGLFLRPTDVYP